jgi:hypothetical protein
LGLHALHAFDLLRIIITEASRGPSGKPNRNKFHTACIQQGYEPNMTSAEVTAETTAAPADGMDEFLTNE